MRFAQGFQALVMRFAQGFQALRAEFPGARSGPVPMAARYAGSKDK
jgi:hypothetical protein